MPFIEVTTPDNLNISVNTDLVLYVEPNGERTKIHFTNGNHLRVQEAYAQVAARLPGAAVIETVEGAPVLEALKPTNEEQTAAAAEHPAKKRETK